MLPSGSSHAFLEAIPLEDGLEGYPLLGAGGACKQIGEVEEKGCSDILFCCQVTSSLGVAEQLLHVLILLCLEITTKLQEASQKLLLLRITSFAFGNRLPKVICSGVLQSSPCRGKALPQGFSLVFGQSIQKLLDILVASFAETFHFLFQGHGLVVALQFPQVQGCRPLQGLTLDLHCLG